MMNYITNITRIIIVSVILSFTLYSQNESPEVTLSDPYNTIRIHLLYLQPENYDASKASKSIYSKNLSDARAKDFAIKLKRIMDAKGLFVKMADVPEDPDYYDSSANEHRYVLFEREPDIYVEKIGDKWYYSEHTVERIPAMFDAAFPAITNAIFEILPEFAFKRFLGLMVWKYFGILLYFISAWVLFQIFSWIFGIIVSRIFTKLNIKEVFNKYIQPISRPLSSLFVVMMLQISISFLQLPIKLSHIANIMLDAAIPILLILVLYRLADLLSDIMARIAEKTATTVDDNLVPLVRKAIKVGIVILGSIYVISTLGWDVTPLIAGASVGGLAFALAAQDTIKNLFGSVTIFTDQPFEVGDWIVFNGGEGMVEEVGVRSTRIRTFHNSLISIPNGKLSDALIDNMGRREFRRFSTKISITYDTPTALIDAYVQGLKDIVENHPKTRKDYYQIHLNELGAASINILFYIFFKVPDWTEELIARHEVISESITLAEKLGVRFAFPTQTIHIEEMPGQESLTPVYKQSKDEFMKLVRDHNQSKQIK